VIRELLAGETRLAYNAMLELRPAVGDEAAFVKRIDGNKGMRISAYHFSRTV
jgi:hypothetical protein